MFIGFFFPQLKCVCVSFCKYYLDSHTECMYKIIYQQRAVAPFVSCPAGRQERAPVQHRWQFGSSCPGHGLSLEGLPMPHWGLWNRSPAFLPYTPGLCQQLRTKGSSPAPSVLPHSHLLVQTGCVSGVEVFCSVLLCLLAVPMEGAKGAQALFRGDARRAVVRSRAQHMARCCCAQLRSDKVPWVDRQTVIFIWSQIKFKWQAGGWIPKDVVILTPPFFFSSGEHRSIFYKM